MKIPYKTFKLMVLIPAVYNGDEIEIDVQLNNDSLYHTDISVAEAIDMKPGDTVHIRGRILFDHEDTLYEFITIYMSEAVLTEFIEKYGFNKITDTIGMKVKFIYAVHCSEDFYNEEKKEEIIACKLLKILSNQDEKSTDKSNTSSEMRDYFTDGMK